MLLDGVDKLKDTAFYFVGFVIVRDGCVRSVKFE